MKTRIIAGLVLAISLLSASAGTLVASVSPLNSQPVMPGTINQTVYSITFEGIDTDEDVRVTALSVGLQTQNGFESAFLANWRLLDVFQLGATAAMLPYTFNVGSSLIVTQGTAKTLTLSCDISHDAHGEFRLSLGAVQCIGVTSGTIVELSAANISARFVQILGLPSVNRGELDFSISERDGSPVWDFIIHGTTGYRYQIEESYNLTNWHALSDMVTATSTNTTLWVPAGTNAHAFFRFQEFLPCQLVFEADASTPYVQMVAAGSTNVILSVFKFSAFYEEVMLPSVGLRVNGDPSCIRELSLWDGNVKIGHSFSSMDTSMLVYLSRFSIPKYRSKTLTIKANLSSIGIGEALMVSGHQVGVALDDSNPDWTVGIGMESGRAIQVCGDGRTPGGAWVFKSFPTVTLDTLPTEGVSDGRLLRFKIAASTSGSISIYKIAPWLNFSGMTITNINLHILNTGGQFSATNFSGSPGVLNMYAQTPIVIPAGAVYTFELRGNVQIISPLAWAGSQLSGDCCDGCGGSLYTANNVEQCHPSSLIWSPNSLGISSLTDPDWKNAEGIEGMPSLPTRRTP